MASHSAKVEFDLPLECCDARLYDATDTSVKGIHAMFMIRGEPETDNLPPKPEAPTVYLKEGWKSAAFEAVAMVGAVVASFLLWSRKG
jgi:hypothetical protein